MIFGPFPGPALRDAQLRVFSYVAGARDYTELFTTTQGLPRNKAARRARSVKLKRLDDVWPPSPPSARLPEADLSPEQLGQYWLGPFPWAWIVAAFESAGMNGVLVGLCLWHLYNSQHRGDHLDLGAVKFDLPIVRPNRQKAVREIAQAGLISIQHNPGMPPNITLIPRRVAGDVPDLRGPLPIEWILKAASFGRAGLMYGLALWRLAGKYNSATVRFWRDGAGICPNLILDAARRSAQRKLAAARLISVKRMGGAPTITILPGPVVSGTKLAETGGPLDKPKVEENEKEIALVETASQPSTNREAA
jgi:hypothetical protein